MSIARFAVRVQSRHRLPCLLAMMMFAGSCGVATASSIADHAHRHTENGNATVTWDAPTANADGSALTNLDGYQIDYGTDSAALTNSVQVPNAGATSYTLSNLPSGTWYFTVRAHTNSGLTSDASSVTSKRVK
jgi:hypothetical protein